MSDDKLYDAIQRGHLAKELLNNALLWDCFDMLDSAYIQAWRETPTRDAVAREKWWQATHVLGKVRENLVTILNNGKLAQADLSLRQKKAA